MSQTNSGSQSLEPTPRGSSVGVPSFPAVPDNQETIISNRPPLTSPAHSDLPGENDLGEFRPGAMIGPYELIEFVGGGGMGRVFRALDTQLGRVVALKVLPSEQTGHTETLLRFRNEARSAARLDHDTIARVYHVGDDQGFPYVAFEFIHGRTLRRMVEQGGPLSLVDAVAYTLQIAEALAHMTQRGVIHRDIKPSNVIITPASRAKVIDLGLAKLEEVDEAHGDLTASGVTLGTFDYISPEQARDPRHVDIRGDIYSLGCTFFFMLTGRPPFPEGTVLQKLLQHQGDEPPELSQFRPDVPEDVSAVLRRMLAKDRAARFQTPDELIVHLHSLAERLGLRPMGHSGVWSVPKPEPVSVWHRHLPWMAPVAVLLCVVLVLDSLWQTPKSTSTANGRPGNGATTAPTPPEKTVPDLPKATPLEGANGEPAVGPAASSGLSGNGASSVGSPPASSSSATPLKQAEPKPIEPTPAAPTVPRVAASEPMQGDWDPSTFPADLTSGPDGAVSRMGLHGEPLPNPFDLDTLLSGESADRSGLSVPLPPKLSGVLTVSDAADGVRSFPSLAAACAAAHSGNVIELCFNGRRSEQPITFSGTKLVIRAGEGFRPVLVFQPNESDRNKYPRGMFRLSGSELRLVKVALELDLSRNVPADQWSLVDVGRGESIRLEECSLTIRNAYHQEAAFFDIQPTPDTAMLDAEEVTPPLPAAAISLVDCVVRGDATVVRTEGLQPVAFTWTNGLLATDRHLLWAVGGDMAPEPGEEIRLTLKHLTALAREGLCQLDAGQFDGYHLPVKVDCSDSILLVDPLSALIEQAGAVEQAGAASESAGAPGLIWVGDRNFYQGLRTFWKIDDPTSPTPSTAMDFEAWQRRWGPEHEGNSFRGRVDFARLPEANRPTHDHAPTDYGLTDSPGNWARGAASDGSDVGLSPNRLPPLPAEKE